MHSCCCLIKSSAHWSQFPKFEFGGPLNRRSPAGWCPKRRNWSASESAAIDCYAKCCPRPSSVNSNRGDRFVVVVVARFFVSLWRDSPRSIYVHFCSAFVVYPRCSRVLVSTELWALVLSVCLSPSPSGLYLAALLSQKLLDPQTSCAGAVLAKQLSPPTLLMHNAVRQLYIDFVSKEWKGHTQVECSYVSVSRALSIFHGAFFFPVCICTLDAGAGGKFRFGDHLL